VVTFIKTVKGGTTKGKKGNVGGKGGGRATGKNAKKKKVTAAPLNATDEPHLMEREGGRD